MDNFSDIALSAEKVSLRKKIGLLRKSMELLKNKQSDYYEHHQHLINTYKEIMEVIDQGINDSQDIGRGI